MKAPTSTEARTAWRSGSDRTKRLLGRRRPQLLFAVVLGAVIGGGFTAVASVGLGDHEHDGRVGVSVSGQPSGQPGEFGDQSGYDNNHR